MSLTLDPQTELRVQRAIARGHYLEPIEVVNRALDLLEAEEWTEEDKAELDQSLDLARAQIARGEFFSGKELREDYERRRVARAG